MPYEIKPLKDPLAETKVEARKQVYLDFSIKLLYNIFLVAYD